MHNNVYLTDEEKAIIVDFMSCAIGEGYKGGGMPFNNGDIDEKLATIAQKLGFSRNEIGVDYIFCKHGFEKDGIKIKEDDKCFCVEFVDNIGVSAEGGKYLELTYDEANEYFHNVPNKRLNTLDGYASEYNKNISSDV